MAAVSDAVQVSIISTFGGIAIAYIVNVIAKKVEANRAAKNPKDRIELAFEWYDKALQQRDEDNAELRKELRQALQKVEESDRTIYKLRQELVEVRSDYRKHKGEERAHGAKP